MKLLSKGLKLKTFYGIKIYGILKLLLVSGMEALVLVFALSETW